MVAFLIIGGIGFLMLVMTWFMGELFDFGHDVASFLGDHSGFDFGHDFGHDAGHDAGPSPMSSRVIFTFMTAFGGGGAVASLYDLSALVSVFIALVSGLVVGGATWGFARLVHQQQATSGLEMEDLVGRTARVVIGIPAGGVGQVTVNAAGGSSTFVARSRTGYVVQAGALVQVVEVQGDIVIVEAADRVSGS